MGIYPRSITFDPEFIDLLLSRMLKSTSYISLSLREKSMKAVESCSQEMKSNKEEIKECIYLRQGFSRFAVETSYIVNIW